MAQVHMTIDPHMTHTVMDIIREKFYKGDIAGLEEFMKSSFGIGNDKIISRILRGEYVMVFNEDGTGDCKHMDEVTADEAEAMGGLPEYWSRDRLASMVREYVSGAKKKAEELYKYMNLMDFHNINKKFDIYYDSDIYDGKLGHVHVELSTRELINIYKKSGTDEQSRDMMKNILDSDSKAASIIFICKESNRQVQEYRRIESVIRYIKTYWEEDIEDFDVPRFYKKDGLDPEEMLQGINRWYIYTPYKTTMINIMQDYQYIFADPKEQDTYSAGFVARAMQAEQEIKSYSDFIKAQTERNIGPVKINHSKWDAGWISPDGHVWVACGSKANLIHLNLADNIFEYMEWPDSDNKDYELDRRGWVKFHDNEIAFAGYQPFNRHRITKRQMDRLSEYAKCKGYSSLHPYFRDKSINIRDMYDMSDEQWENFFK